MAKNYNIKWREEDVDQLRREIRNFNRKVDRLMKKGSPEVKAALPPKLSMKTAKAGIQSRADYNRQLKQIRRFTEKGSEQLMKTSGGVTAPKFEIKEMQARVAQSNRQRKAARERIGTIDAGNKPLMGRIREQSYMPKKAVGKVRPEDWDQYKRSVMKQSAPDYKTNMDAAYKDNYFKMLDNLFAEDEDAADLQEMKDIIDSMTTEDFIDQSLNDDVLYIQFYRDPIKREVKKDLIRDKIKNLRRR